MSDDQHVHIHIHGLESLASVVLSGLRLLRDIRDQLKSMETKMATIDDLNTAVDGVQGVLTANDARVAALATAVSDAASAAAAHDADMAAQIQALKDQIAAGGDPAAFQAVVDKLSAMSTEGVTEGQAIDSATTALAAAFPKPAAP